MASSIQILRSTTAKERPFPGSLLEGQPAVNVNATEPGLFFKASDGSLFKIGPAAITSDGAPPNTGGVGQQGNCTGELWLDKSVNPPVLKIYDGTQWVDAGSGGGGGGGYQILRRWIKTVSGGETSLSGSDDSVPPQQLDYIIGLEEVFVNGVLLTRGVDYTTPNTFSITNLAPLTANDVVTVLSWSTFDPLGPIDGALIIDETITSTKLGDEAVTTNKLDDGAVTPSKLDDEAVITSKLADNAVVDSKVSPSAAIDSSKLSFLQSGAGASSRSVQSRLRDTVSVLDYGADPTGAADSTTAINTALNEHKSVFIPEGTYRIDSTIVIESGFFIGATGKKSLSMTGSTRLIRKAANSASTAPVLLLKGNYGVFDGGGGEIESENDSPGGVVALGHENTTTSNYNGLFWTFKNCGVRCKNYVAEPAVGATVGVYVPSSQPTLGATAANYFGTVENVRVYGASVSYWLTDAVNAHTFVNTTIEFFWHYGYRLNGAYGNTFYSGFVNGCYKNGGTVLYLGNKLAPSAPYAASHQSNNNNFYGATIELYSSGNYGVFIPPGVAGYDSAHNVVQIGWNSVGTAFEDQTASKANQCDDGQILYETYKNFKINQGGGSGTGLLKINGSFPTTHYLGRDTVTGSPVIILENQNTANSSGVGMQIQWNTPVVGFNTQLLSGYHNPTSAFRFDILDTGDMRNVNNSYGPLVSERRFKQDIEDASSQWEDIKSVRWRNFRYIKDVEERGDNAEVQLGVIIDELESVCPNLITESPEIVQRTIENDDGTTDIVREEVGKAKSWKTSVLLMKGMKALQEAMERIEALEEQVAELTSKLKEN